MIQKAQKRKGNLLMVVLLMVMFVAILYGLYLLGANNLYSSRDRVKSTGGLYSNMAAADLFADAFFSDISAGWELEPPRVGDMTITIETYEELLARVNDKYFQVDSNNPDRVVFAPVAQDGITRVEVTAEAILGAISISDVVPSAERRAWSSEFNRLTRAVSNLVISVDNGLAPDLAHSDNILNNQNGDKYVLKDIHYNLDFSVGAYKYHREYMITGLIAEFVLQPEGLYCKINSEVAEMVLLRQDIRA